jgi:AraC-like DNA-binding protein
MTGKQGDVVRQLSVSAFHRSFPAVMAMTPIQFQKHIRLQAARLLRESS